MFKNLRKSINIFLDPFKRNRCFDFIKYFFIRFKNSKNEIFNLNYYDNICNLTDKILKDHNYDRDILAINFLSPVRADIYSSNIYQIMPSENFFKFFLSQLIGFLFIFVKLLIQILSSIKCSLFREKKELYFNNNFSNANKDTLMITHADKISQIFDDNDLYYGKRSRHDADFCILDKTGSSDKNKDILISKSNLTNISLVETEGFNFGFSLIIYKKMINLFFKLFNYWFEEPFNRVRIILLKESLSKSTFLNISICLQMNNILKNHSYNRIISTWEGYPWERLLANICNKKQIKLFGYIHAGPFPTQHAAHRYLPTKFTPTEFLTPTTIAQKLLEKYYSTSSTVVGSHKLFNVIRRKKIQNLTRDKNFNKLLLLPQGTYKEVIDLCKLAFNSSLLDTEIIIRLHPALVNNERILYLIKRLQKNSLNPELISISRRSLEEDLLESSYFLYRGSTSAIDAAFYGLTPIYFKSDDPFNSHLNSLDGIELPKFLNISKESELEEIILKSSKCDISDLIKDIYGNSISFKIN